MRYIIQAVPERAEYVRYLTDRISTAEVYWDEDANPLAAFMSVMEMAGDEPFVRLEDDVLLCPDFEREVERRASMHPQLGLKLLLPPWQFPRVSFPHQTLYWGQDFSG